MSHALWYATRSTGIAALILLTLVVALGVSGSLRLRSDRWPRFLVVGLHRNLTLLALAVLTGHIATTVLDSYTPIRLLDAFVPFISRYRPIWVGLGAVALDLLLALTVTSLLRARIGYRNWRALHWLAYAAWPIALAHGLGTGSDARFGWMQAITLVCAGIVLIAVTSRITRSGAEPALRVLAGATTVAVVVVGGLWYRGGPGARGWAARAGTPKTLLAATRPGKVGAAAPTLQRVSDVPAVPFSAQLNGRLTTTGEGGGLVRVDIRGRTHGGVQGVLWIRLQGPASGDGVEMTASGVRFGPPSNPNLYTGAIRALQGTELVTALHDAAGRRIDLDVVLRIDQTTGTFTGTVQAAGASE